MEKKRDLTDLEREKLSAAVFLWRHAEGDEEKKKKMEVLKKLVGDLEENIPCWQIVDVLIEIKGGEKNGIRR